MEKDQGLMIERLLSDEAAEAYNGVFFDFRPGDTKKVLTERLKSLKAIGINNILAGYSAGGMEVCKFDEVFYTALDEVVKACRALDMSFWFQDYSPFPTGSANGAFEEPENIHLNKLFVDERHIDISGPMENAVIRIDELQQVVYGNTMHRFAKVDPLGRQRLGVVAYRMQENPAHAASLVLEDGTAVLLDAFVEGEFLTWSVPEGHWRVFVLFTTHESSGRAHYMNLLSRESVALELEKVHKPIYERLKSELGKTWKGFFYDEPEIGNNGGADVFDFFMLPGRRTQDTTDCSVYPWSAEMPAEMAKRDGDWLKKLPALWYDAQTLHRQLRGAYMDAVSALVRDNYNGQVYAFCRERGIHYIGHVLEDEGSHARLGCGPGHYFRQQYYQDEAGIDVIAGQILPGGDKAASWYGVVNSDGEFYHYGLAKLASSEAHINPLKKNCSACETFAMYGPQGLAERKFLVDHLMVNGINRILYGEVSAYDASPEYAKMLVEYTDKVCGLLRNTRPVIKTAILYHAEAEWQEGAKAQSFQKPAAQLAKNQISYDVIPADVFTLPEMYGTQTDGGLRVNGHAYEALIIPACGSLPPAVAAFVRQCGETGFPVFFTDRIPDGFSGSEEPSSNLHLVGLDELAEAVRKEIQTDIRVQSSQKQWIRVAHVQNGEQHFYLIHNEAPYAKADCDITLEASGEVLAIDPVSGMVLAPVQEAAGDGRVKVSLRLGRFEMKILYCTDEKNDVSTAWHCGETVLRPGKETLHNAGWELELPSGQIISSTPGELPQPGVHLDRDFYGKLVYRTKWCEAGELPRLLDLGAVSDCCEVILNGQRLGKRIAAPYLFDVRTAIQQGENELVAEVYTSAVNIKNDKNIFGVPLGSLTARPYTLVEPMGISGEVKWIF